MPPRARCADRGAVGFVVKDAAPQELELALRAAHAGQVFLSPQISAKMLAPMLGREKPTGIAALSPRQREILRRIGKGESNKEIAADLGISVKTVETHRARMMESLGCRRANDLLLLAARHQHELGERRSGVSALSRGNGPDPATPCIGDEIPSPRHSPTGIRTPTAARPASPPRINDLASHFVNFPRCRESPTPCREFHQMPQEPPIPPPPDEKQDAFHKAPGSGAGEPR
jgi:DNA-binding CsgD family transcriptional regulator